MLKVVLVLGSQGVLMWGMGGRGWCVESVDQLLNLLRCEIDRSSSRLLIRGSYLLSSFLIVILLALYTCALIYISRFHRRATLSLLVFYEMRTCLVCSACRLVCWELLRCEWIYTWVNLRIWASKALTHNRHDFLFACDSIGDLLLLQWLLTPSCPTNWHLWSHSLCRQLA